MELVIRLASAARNNLDFFIAVGVLEMMNYLLFTLFLFLLFCRFDNAKIGWITLASKLFSEILEKSIGQTPLFRTNEIMTRDFCPMEGGWRFAK
jgi:hypothetical protein